MERNKLDEILKEAERFMEESERLRQLVNNNCDVSRESKTSWFTEGIYYGVRALYEQNKAIIELLKSYKEATPKPSD